MLHKSVSAVTYSNTGFFFGVFSAADWRYAAEQFVKKLPDKVIVHREFSLSHVVLAFPAH